VATLNSAQNYGNLTISGSGTKTVATGDILIVTGTLTLTNGNINTGTVAARGNITQASTFDGGTGTLLIDGTGAQTFTGSATTSAGDLPNLNINKTAGTLTLAGTIRTTDDWTYTAGTLDAGTSTVIFAGTQTITGSHTLNNVEFGAGTTKTIAAGTTLTVPGTLTLTDGSISTGTVDAQGGVTHASTFDGGTGLITITGAATRTINLTGNGDLPGVTLNAPNVTLNGPSSGTTIFEGTTTSFTLQAGTVTGGAGAMTFNLNYGQSGGTFTGGAGTVTVTGDQGCGVVDA
jgi:hypothetical protein